MHLTVEEPIEIQVTQGITVAPTERGFYIPYTILSGKVSSYSIIFNEKSSANRFDNILYKAANVRNEIDIPLPYTFPEDVYGGHVIFHHGEYCSSDSIPFRFVVVTTPIEVIIEDTVEAVASDGKVSVVLQLNSGDVTEYSILFDDDATANGFEDIDFTPMNNSTQNTSSNQTTKSIASSFGSSEVVIDIPLPASVASGTYNGYFIFRNEIYDTEPIPFSFEVTGIENSLFTFTVEHATIIPNPVKAGERALIKYDFDERERNGLLVEMFNSTGTRIYAVRPESYPIYINGLNRSGIYFIRISTGTNKIFTSKLIVK